MKLTHPFQVKSWKVRFLISLKKICCVLRYPFRKRNITVTPTSLAPIFYAGLLREFANWTQRGREIVWRRDYLQQTKKTGTKKTWLKEHKNSKVHSTLKWILNNVPRETKTIIAYPNLTNDLCEDSDQNWHSKLKLKSIFKRTKKESFRSLGII